MEHSCSVYKKLSLLTLITATNDWQFVTHIATVDI